MSIDLINRLEAATGPDRDAIISVMCDAYCQTSGSGGGKRRYASAMARILAALETSGYQIVKARQS